MSFNYLNTIFLAFLASLSCSSLSLKETILKINSSVNEVIRYGEIPFEYLKEMYDFTKRIYRIKLIFVQELSTQLKFSEVDTKHEILNNFSTTYDCHILIREYEKNWRLIYITMMLYIQMRILLILF